MIRIPVRFDVQCTGVGLPRPVLEHRFHPTRRWRFDYCWPEVKLALEVNGGAFARAGGRHTRGAGFRADCEKFSEAAILGWRVLHVLPEQVRTGAALDLAQRAFASVSRPPSP